MVEKPFFFLQSEPANRTFRQDLIPGRQSTCFTTFIFLYCETFTQHRHTEAVQFSRSGTSECDSLFDLSAPQALYLITLVELEKGNKQPDIWEMWLDDVHNEFRALDQSHLSPLSNLAVEDWRVI